MPLARHEEIADRVGEVLSALWGLAELGQADGRGLDTPGYRFGGLAACLAATLEPAYCALGDWIMHDRRADAHAPEDEDED